MKEIMEHYGLGLLEIVAVAGMVAIVFNCVGTDGVISNIVADFMITICG